MHHHHHLLSEEERPVAATRTYYKRERGEREMNVFFLVFLLKMSKMFRVYGLILKCEFHSKERRKKDQKNAKNDTL
tara:strand:+ start:116 stop:343 length:228 start_codon:yes stop_codon:yes gene_type:complete